MPEIVIAGADRPPVCATATGQSRSASTYLRLLGAYHESPGEVGSANSNRELVMPVVLIHQGPTVTAENYRATVQKLAGKDKMESVSDWPVGGILSHAAGESPSGFRVVDVWESQDACEAFGEHLRPILEEVGITDPPEMYPAEAFVSS